MILGGCVELAKVLPAKYQFTCCGSCHDDYDEGWDHPSEVDTCEDGYYSLCCAGVAQLNKYLQDSGDWGGLIMGAGHIVSIWNK